MHHPLSWLKAFTHQPRRPVEPGGISNPHQNAPQIFNEVKSTFFDFLGLRDCSTPTSGCVDDGNLLSLDETENEVMPVEGTNEALHLSGDQLIPILTEILAELNRIQAVPITSRESRRPESVDERKQLWRKRAREHRKLFLQRYKIFTDIQDNSPSPTLKRLASKFTFQLRMWLGGSTPRLGKLRHLDLYDGEQERMLEYFHQTYTIIDLLPRAASALERGDGELLALLEEIEATFERLGKRFLRLYYQLSLWLETAFDAEHDSSNDMEYPQGQRYRCTTMPWTIWPALVVLWGVCWMFYGFQGFQPAGAQKYPFLAQLAEHEDHTLDFEFSDQAGDDWTNAFNHMTFLEPELLDNLPDMTLVDQGGAVLLQTSDDFSNPQYQSDSVLSQSPANTVSPSVPQLTLPSQAPSRALKTRHSRASRNDKLVCSICQRKFRRTDVLRRHRNEQHGEGGAAVFLCPEQGCKRASSGLGFKRQEQLDRHLFNCKQRKRSLQSRPHANQQSPESLNHHLPSSPGSCEVQQSERSSSCSGVSEWVTALDDGPSSSDDDSILGLKRFRNVQQQKLDDITRKMEELRSQYERNKQYLDRLDDLINDCEQVFPSH